MMSFSKATRHAPIFPILIFLFFISSFRLSYSVGNNTILCPQIEMLSLLNLKQHSLSNEYLDNQLTSWDGKVNCCEWKFVICDELTGHVRQLHLNNTNLYGNLNSSLLNLKHLIYLDLSGNSFTRETIPSFIGSFAKLEYLDLSCSFFRGKVPHTIGNLSNLRTLNLQNFGYFYPTGELFVDSLDWLSGLSRLEFLNMDGVDLSKAKSWAQVINSLPSLVKLSFQLCNLDFITNSLDDVNISASLNHLYFYSSNWGSPISCPRWFFQLANLVSLDLGWNKLTGPFPTFTNSTKLQTIDLSSNHFNSIITDGFYLCKDLEYVDLSDNRLTGTISNSIANMTSLNTLIAPFNHLSGKIPKEIGRLCKIERLDLSFNNFQGDIFGNMPDLRNNKLSGHLTRQFGEFKSLERLYLSNNSLTGNLPESLGQLFNLQKLFVDNNKLEGVVTETHFANLTKLEMFSASRNNLTLKVSPNWNPPFQVNTLLMASWNLGLGSEIPSWIEKQKNLLELDLSNTGISGSIPSCVWKIQVLTLSHNRLNGKIRIANTTVIVDLSNNSFHGGIDHFLCDIKSEFQLRLLNLGENQLSGELPDCWTKLPNLQYLNLGNNNMSGSIPNSIGFLKFLESLKLYGNKLSGEIPFSIHNCTELRLINLADNGLDGDIPKWVGTNLIELKFLILRSNKLSGNISPEICLLNNLQILDLSDNKLSGIIPRCLSNLSAMATNKRPPGVIVIDPYFKESASIVIKGSELEYGTTLDLVTNINLSKNNLSGNIPKELTSLAELRSLNLSQNRLTGSIPAKIGDMKQLESLDFSMNSLSGQIPNSLALVSFLNYLNLSYNNLTGEIPKSVQLQSLDASSFRGNNLCGPPLTRKCNNDGDEGHEHKEENEEEDADDESKIKWLYVVVSLGYAVGLSGVLSALVLNKLWREAYFGLLKSVWDKLYVYIWIKYNKLSGRG